MDVMNSWHLIETLTPGVMTVVSSGGRTRNWTKVDRLSPASDIDLPCSSSRPAILGRSMSTRSRAVAEYI